MKLFKFTFKNEALWMIVLSVAPVVIGFLIFAVVWFLRTAR
jgi:hypothetical protein